MFGTVFWEWTTIVRCTLKNIIFKFISIIQDVKSLNSFWNNIYFHEDNNLDQKYKGLFFYFEWVFKENVGKRINMLQSQKNHKKEDQFEFFYEVLKKTKTINKVDSFFEGGQFKGYTFFAVF